MSMQRLSAATALATLVLASGWAGANPFPAPPTGPVFIHLTADEQLSASNTILGPSASQPNHTVPYDAVNTSGKEGNWGIVQISSIERGTVTVPHQDIQGGGPFLFTNGQSGGQQILGIFYGVHFDLLNNPSLASGGVLDLYGFEVGGQNTGTELLSGANLAKRTLQDQYTGYTCATNTANCTFLARLDFVYGANGAGDTTTTIVSPINPTTSDGVAKSYLAVDFDKVGPWSAALDGNFFTKDPNGLPLPNTPDVRLDNTFNHGGGANWTTPANDNVGLLASDPARAFLVVPEPASLTMLAAGLLGLGALGRRRNRMRG
jgi:hypothetical protein